VAVPSSSLPSHMYGATANTQIPAGREVPAALPPVGSRGHEEWRLVKVRRWRIAEPSQGIRAAKAAEDHQLSNIRYYF
jgi:hypothetical protein